MSGDYLFVERIMAGKVGYFDRDDLTIENLEWQPHAKFKGVTQKHLVKGETNGGKFSCHLIKIGNGFEIGTHIHEGNWELHEVVGGTGIGYMAGREIVYEPGVTVVVPEGVEHKIVADKGDVYILAKFIPALI
jgi:mannose-6-phosphate isomerase-like protein (cupin superfamily)